MSFCYVATVLAFVTLTTYVCFVSAMVCAIIPKSDFCEWQIA